MPPDAEARLEPIESTYGSDKHGLVCAYQMLPGAPAVPLDSAGLTAWLRIADEPGTESFVWLHFSCPTPHPSAGFTSTYPSPTTSFNRSGRNPVPPDWNRSGISSWACSTMRVSTSPSTRGA
jgi:hypothetical protein